MGNDGGNPGNLGGNVGNAGNRGGNAGNVGGNPGNIIEIEKNNMKVYKILFSFFAEIKKKKLP